MSDSLPKDPYLVALRFRPEQLSRARELKGITKTALAGLIDKTPSAITQFEAGVIVPDAETLTRISWVLRMPVQFFGREPLVPKIALEACHFRSLRSASQQVRRQTLRMGEFTHELMVLLENEGIEFPTEQVSFLKQPAETSADVEEAAAAVRRGWGLGNGPIPELIQLLEGKGISILPLTGACQEVDAFSLWCSQRPFILLAMQKNSSRTHFDAAHELGHLVMHEDVQPADPLIEKQANDFAAAFLLPRDTFSQECPTRWSLPTFRALKKRWHVSIRALVYRAHKLGKLSEASYRRANVTLNRLYGSKQEPDEWALQKPRVLRDALLLLQDDVPLEEIADRLALQHRQLEDMLAVVMD